MATEIPCGFPSEMAAFVRLSCQAMATRFEIVLYGEDEARLRSAGEEALEEISRVEKQISRFLPEAELAGINAEASRMAVKVEPRLFRLLCDARRLWQMTDGAFDITVGPLMEAWGFSGSGLVPEEGKLDEVRALCGMQHVLLDQDAWTVSFERQGVMLDLGGIGKGYAIERAAKVLFDAAIQSALIHGGTSTIYAIGRPPSGAWRVGIRHPQRRQEVLHTVIIEDSALSVSAAYGKYFTRDGRNYGHIFNSKSGCPIFFRHDMGGQEDGQGAVLAAVTGPSAAECDALSTALIVLGSSWLDEFRRRFQPYHALVVDTAVSMTEGFRSMS